MTPNNDRTERAEWFLAGCLLAALMWLALWPWGGISTRGWEMGRKKGKGAGTVNITVAIAVHPPQQTDDQPEVSVEVGQAGFTYGSAEDDEEADDDGDDSANELVDLGNARKAEGG